MGAYTGAALAVVLGWGVLLLCVVMGLDTAVCMSNSLAVRVPYLPRGDWVLKAGSQVVSTRRRGCLGDLLLRNELNDLE